jgi:mRNA-degrading endonuclease toxin of MazEF toxin-antitoxin module
VVNLDHIKTAPRARIGPIITRLTAARLDEVRAALLFALGFER